MTTIIKATDPASFLSLVPHLLGFAPTRSMVLVPFDGRSSIGGMRFDLPDTADADEIDRMAATCIGMVCRLADADAVALVVYGDDEVRRSSGRLPQEQLVRAVMRRADACGIELRDALCVAADAWASYLEPATPPTLHDLAELSDRAGAPPLRPGDQSAGTDLPEISAEDVTQTAAALDALDDAIRAITADEPAPAGRKREGDSTARRIEQLDPRSVEAAVRLDEIPTLFEDALGWDPATMPGYDAAILIWCLSRPAVRDVALVQWCGHARDGAAALDAQLQWEQGADYPAELGMRMWGEGPRPRAGRLAAALAVVRQAAALAPLAERPGALAVCAWLSWAAGRSTHAESYARRACEIEPEHGLSEIVLSFVAVGHLPEWAFQSPRPPVRRPKKGSGKGRRR